MKCIVQVSIGQSIAEEVKSQGTRDLLMPINTEGEGLNVVVIELSRVVAVMSYLNLTASPKGDRCHTPV